MNTSDVNMKVLQGSLLQSKKKVSGEISKEPFLDILLTDLEQSSFSLLFKKKALENKEAPTKAIPFTHLKTSSYLFSKSSFVLPLKNCIGAQIPTSLEISHIFNPSSKPCLVKSVFAESPPNFTIKQNRREKNLTWFVQRKVKSKLSFHLFTNQNLVQKKKQISCLVKIGDYVHCGDKIGYLSETPIVINESGKVLRISETQMTLQKIQPVLFYSQAEIHVESHEWVKRGTPILTLTHQTLVTGDIVQGIPRIEQLFEASTAAPPGAALQDFGSLSDDDSSKKSNIDNYLKAQHTSHFLPSTSSFIGVPYEDMSEDHSEKGLQNRQNNDQISDNTGEKRYDSTVHSTAEDKAMFLYKTLQSQVRETFRKKWDQFPLPVAVRQSLEEIQQIIVESIQKVYISQGVLIADKHIEIIVRQMTSKAQVFDGGSTGLLIDEILSLQQIENANISTPGQKALYLPVVMGLTRAALSSDSFVSAASFQETTRVLSRDAVAGKTDFLRGLKEKVIIGDLIDAGTGLDAFYIYSLFSKKTFENKFREILNRKVTHKTLKKLILTVAVPQAQIK